MFKTGIVQIWGRPGGMRWPPGGIIGGSKNTLFEDLQVSKADLDLRVEIWHVDWALGDGSGTLGSAPPQAPGAGGGLPSPRGTTAARPPTLGIHGIFPFI